MRRHSRLRGVWVGLLVFVFGALPALFAQAKPQPASGTVAAVLLSDLHFDPFHDPSKVPQLVKAPVEDWQAILSAPDSPTQQDDFAAIQKACKSKEFYDSPYALLAGSLRAAKAEAADARFVEVSGDLIVHTLDCRYRAALHLPKADGDDQSLSADFAEKTTNFVMKQVETAFKGVPVYFALGNNDSRCNHNRLDVRDAYLKATGQSMVDGLVNIAPAERKQALATYESAGYYSVTMAAPMIKTRLLVVDDIYMMSKFATCEADDADRKGAEEQIAWLAKELKQARELGERVWVLGHLPPAVDPYATLAKGPGLCLGGAAVTMLSTDDLANTLVAHADVIKLGVFGHTHMDELHVLGGATGVPIKVVGSVSPVDGNIPSFTVAKVSTAAAQLVDYTVFKASNMSGQGTTWTMDYNFDQTYGEPNFTAKALTDLIGKFRADPGAATAESKAYQAHYFKGNKGSLAGPLWEGYVCSLDNPSADAFKVCACGGK